MAEGASERVYWYEPDPRAIFDLDRVHFSKSLLKKVRKEHFQVQYSSAFEAVIRACAERNSTWISRELIRAYLQLYRGGFAHSVETWRDETLVGGLYGVALGGAFFGESMFHREDDASKVAFYYLVRRMQDRGFTLLDSQFTNKHLEQFGIIEVPRQAYQQMLETALAQHCRFL